MRLFLFNTSNNYNKWVRKLVSVPDTFYLLIDFRRLHAYIIEYFYDTCFIRWLWHSLTWVSGRMEDPRTAAVVFTWSFHWQRCFPMCWFQLRYITTRGSCSPPRVPNTGPSSPALRRSSWTTCWTRGGARTPRAPLPLQLGTTSRLRATLSSPAPTSRAPSLPARLTTASASPTASRQRGVTLQELRKTKSTLTTQPAFVLG